MDGKDTAEKNLVAEKKQDNSKEGLRTSKETSRHFKVAKVKEFALRREAPEQICSRMQWV